MCLAFDKFPVPPVIDRIPSSQLAYQGFGGAKDSQKPFQLLIYMGRHRPEKDFFAEWQQGPY